MPVLCLLPKGIWCHCCAQVWIAYKGWLVVAKLVVIPLNSTMMGTTCSSACTERLCCLTLCPRQRLNCAPLCRTSSSSFTFSSVPFAIVPMACCGLILCPKPHLPCPYPPGMRSSMLPHGTLLHGQLFFPMLSHPPSTGIYVNRCICP